MGLIYDLLSTHEILLAVERTCSAWYDASKSGWCALHWICMSLPHINPLLDLTVHQQIRQWMEET
jgi:hypothetical protein